MAIKKAITNFQEQIADGTDPQSVFVEGLMGENDPPKVD